MLIEFSMLKRKVKNQSFGRCKIKMKIYEYEKLHGLDSQEKWMNHFRNNLILGLLPVAMYSCPYCQEILYDLSIEHKCINTPSNNNLE